MAGPKSRHEGMFSPGQSGNPGGRPKGSKNKNKLPRAQRRLLNAEDGAIQELIWLSKNDKDKLGRSQDIPANVQLQALKAVLDMVKELKDKLEAMDEEDFELEEENNVRPLFSTKAN